jgi:transcriptional regulator with XRE-family HTH domain
METTLSKNLKNLRKEKNLTQAGLAKLLKISQQAYAKYEVATAEPDVECLKTLAKLYGVSTDYLLGNTELVPLEKPAQQVLTVEQARDLWLASLDPDDKQTIVLFLGLNFKDRLKVQGYVMNMTQQMI